jgi:nucleotide-binding universal stress UspA family protein
MGLPHEGIVKEAESGSRDLIVLGAKGRSFIERTLMGNITRRVIGFTMKDVLVIPPNGAVGWDRILLATDCSSGSQPAINRALDLAQAYGGELVVLSVMDLLLKSQEALGITGEILRRCQDHVTEVQSQGEARNLKVHGVVRKGQAYQAITDLAREEQINLIIMGSHGHTGLTRLLMGGVTERVIGHAPCPVLVVKV